jgi:hypothetical protein
MVMGATALMFPERLTIEKAPDHSGAMKNVFSDLGKRFFQSSALCQKWQRSDQW